MTPLLSDPYSWTQKKAQPQSLRRRLRTGQMGHFKAPYTSIFRLVVGVGVGYPQPRTLKKGGVWSVDTKKSPCLPLGRQGHKNYRVFNEGEVGENK